MTRTELETKLTAFLRAAAPIHQPTTLEHLNRLIAAGMLPKEDLKPDTYYFGTCRNASVALWQGEFFIYKRHKFTDTFNEEINHAEDDDGYDLFYPIAECVPEEREKILKRRV